MGVNISKRPLIRFGMTLGVVVFGLLLLIAALFADSLSKYLDRLIIQQFLFRLDFRYWSTQIAYPLWSFFALLIFDTITFRRTATKIPDTQKKSYRYDAIVLSIKIILAIITFYFIVNSCFIIRGWWMGWYTFSFLLLNVFFIRWYRIYRTSKNTGITATCNKERHQFLLMSLVITGEISAISFLQVTWLFRPLYFSLYRWFGYGDYSHLAALAFFLICTAVAVTIYVIKEWFTAIRKSLQNTESPSSTPLS